MRSPGSITIIGGGLAGLTLGIGLRQRGVPATVWEAGHYPRHRVCGEFISGRGQAVLQRLGLIDAFEKAGAYRAATTLFVCGPNQSPVRRLTTPALCLSRHRMDALLAEEFRRLGGGLKENSRWTSPAEEGHVQASGRRVHPTDDGWRWFGLKVHVHNVTPAADLEMHVAPEGYVGINRINGDEVNVCGLFRARPGETLPGSAKRDLLRGRPGSPRYESLTGAVFDEDSFCSVAGLSLRPHKASRHPGCSIGDALTMIPPVTGNGMSMAFESAEMALEPLLRWSHGDWSWTEARHAIAHACDAAFTQRLAWARVLQWLTFSPLLRSPAGSLLLKSNLLWDWMFHRTR